MRRAPAIALCTSAVVVIGAISTVDAISAMGTAHADGRPSSSSEAHTLQVGALTRTYRVHAPGAVAAGTRVPLVIVLHGAGATAKEVERRYHWDPLANREGFVVAYPQALGRRWNDSADAGKPDDVGFLRALLDDLTARYPVDPARVYVTGISNGGIMTYLAGCTIADRVVAIGPVAAWFPACVPSIPVSVIHIHGLKDDIFAFAGDARSPSVPTGLARWRAADGCPAAGAVDRHGEVTRRAWGRCRAGTAVELITIKSGRHEWPRAVPKPGNDPVSNALDATATIWSFFEAHPR